MYKVVHQGDGVKRQIEESKVVNNLITKDISPDVSLSVVTATEHHSDEQTSYDRIYYVLDGELRLTFSGDEVILASNDSCFVSRDTTYQMDGTFRVIIVNSPAFGTIDLL
jgi:ethanolamine utilization protein EutQ (cupin superfamily)